MFREFIKIAFGDEVAAFAVVGLVESYGLLLVPVLLGALAVFLLLPRPNRSLPVAGLVTAVVAALAVLVVAGVRGFGNLGVENFLFWVFGGLAVLAGGLLITQRNPARGAIAFVVVVLSTCGMFLLQAAPFLSAATVVVYAGAIIVTFLFVLMLSQPAALSDANDRSREPFLATLFGFLLASMLMLAVQANYQTAAVAEQAAESAKAEAAVAADSVFAAERILGEQGSLDRFIQANLNNDEDRELQWDVLTAEERARLVTPVRKDLTEFVKTRPITSLENLAKAMETASSWSQAADVMDGVVKTLGDEKRVPPGADTDAIKAKAVAAMKELDAGYWKVAQVKLREIAKQAARDRWETGRLSPRPRALGESTATALIPIVAGLESFTPKETPAATKDDFMDRFILPRNKLFPEAASDTTGAGRREWPAGVEPFVDAISEAYKRTRNPDKFTPEQVTTAARSAGAMGRALLRDSSPSAASGLPSNTPFNRVPLGKDGRPLVPAANVAALGRSLFTDYLLAVEMGGTLLLVATVGAIAITARRPEGLA